MPAVRKYGFHPRIEDAPIAAQVVYAISDGTAIKIGKCAGHPMLRLKELQVGNPRELRLLAWTGTLTELQAHRMLERCHVRGEWFQMVAVLDEVTSWDWLDEALWRELKRG